MKDALLSAAGQPASFVDAATARREPWDVLVIGGGIVGSGIARDAVMRGLATVLCEQHDFASGTSSRSSRLLHGGIRYLAQGRVGLVYEASREKRVLSRIAPHLAQPLAFVFPCRRGSGWPRWKLAIGVKLYDAMCGRNLGPSSVLNPQETLAAAPGLSSAGLTGAVRYFDGLTNDARLTIDTLRSAAAHGAAVGNYVALEQAIPEGSLWRCRLTCRQTNTSFDAIAKCVVNAAGPWSDRIPRSKTALRLTKGVHLVVPQSRLPLADAVVMAESERILFAIPWGECVILGTTDTDYDGPLERPTCTAADLDYVLDVVNHEFPQARLTAADVRSTWAGLRPLVADRSGNPSSISRRHEIKMSNPGWWDVTGGKLTTYRLMAEETLDSIVKFLRLPGKPSRTATTPLLESAGATAVSGIIPPLVSQEAVAHCCAREWVVHLDDLMVRRTSWRYYHADHFEIAERVASWMQRQLGWSDERRAAELLRYRDGVAGDLESAPLDG